MPADAPSLERAAEDYAALLTARLGPALALDICVLGLGPDGHVCSIFPGHPVMRERERIVAPVLDSPKPPPRRITMTLPLLLRARQTIVTALSPDKRAVLDAALGPDAADLPITRIFRQSPDVVVLRAAP
jgi:6-phosphogluconolactonase